MPGASFSLSNVYKQKIRAVIESTPANPATLGGKIEDLVLAAALNPGTVITRVRPTRSTKQSGDDNQQRPKHKLILCIDFDGVLHSYTSGWQGPRTIADPPVPGAIDWLISLCDVPESLGHFAPESPFDVCIYSSRSGAWWGRRAMRKWLVKYGLPPAYLDVIRFPVKKPAAWLTIDDRAICFDGEFPGERELLSFRPWNK